MDRWEYRGYIGIAELDTETRMIFGRVAGLRDVITFRGETEAEARRAFEESVDSYLTFCASRGEAPERPGGGIAEGTSRG